MRQRSSLGLYGVLLLVCTFLAGCGDGYSGTTYTVEGGAGLIEKIEFRSDNKVFVTGLGGTKEGTYKIDGDKVTIGIAGDNAVFTRNSDGVLEGPLGMKFKKS